MAESQESSEKNHDNLKKNDVQPECPPPVIWSEKEKFQLADYINIYGISNTDRIVKRISTKTVEEVMQKLAQIKIETLKEVEEMKNIPLISMIWTTCSWSTAPSPWA